MFKFDKLKSSFDCDLCNKLLIDPVVMPCGNFICKAHIDKLLTNASNEKKTLLCGICQEEHFIPKNGFVVNNRLQNLLELELFDLKASPVFSECKKEIEDAKDNLAKIKFLQKNSENYLYDYFEDIKRQVDIRREDLKFKIDKYLDDIIKSVENTQANYIKLSKEVNQISSRIERSKKELNDMTVVFDTMEFNDEKFEEIKSSVEDVNQEFRLILDEYQDSLVGNEKYTFQFNELPIEDIFGHLVHFEFDWDSIILDKIDRLELYQLCELPQAKKWKLQYRASRDGFTAENFHSKCDLIENTLTVIKSTDGNVFGGYVEKAWSKTSDSYVADPKAYIFSLINKEYRPFKVMCTNSNYAIKSNTSCGPVFGDGSDIHVAINSNANKNSFCNFGSAYTHADYQKGTDKAKAILAGSYNFQTLEIEVFTKTH